MAGTTAGLDFGLVTAVGTYSVSATNTSTGCQIGMSGTPSVFTNPVQSVYSVTGGGGYCLGGTGVAVGLSSSQNLINYQLYNGASPVGSPVVGSGFPITFGLQTAAGTYTVVATDPSSLCTSNMLGSATVVINPLPSAISGTTIVCPGSSSTLSSAPSGGTWSSLSPSIATIGSTSGVLTGVIAGTATIVYTLPTTCSSSTTITVNSLPAAITGTMNVCVGLTTTLSDPTGGGTWSSSNTLTANINISSGLVLGVSSGTVTMTYTLATGCTATTPFTVNPTPAAIGSDIPVCGGSSITLTDATTGGTWISSNAAVASVGSSSGIVTGGVA